MFKKLKLTTRSAQDVCNSKHILLHPRLFKSKERLFWKRSDYREISTQYFRLE